MKPQRLNIESEALEEFRQNLNAAMEIVACQLIRRNLTKGTVSAKVAITIEERADEKTGEVYYDVVLEPGVSMKIGTSDRMKCRAKSAVMKQDGMGRPLIASAQVGMDEILEEGDGNAEN